MTEIPHGPTSCPPHPPSRPPRRAASGSAEQARVVLSFDVEEHYRIEAAAGLTISPDYKTHCRERLDVSTRWILERLARDGVRATFFIVGQIAEHNPRLIRDIHGRATRWRATAGTTGACITSRRRRSAKTCGGARTPWRT